MILRVNPDNSVVIVKSVPPEQEDEFMRLNSKGKIKFIKLDKLPDTKYNCLKYDGKNIVPDEECIKRKSIEELNSYTETFITSELNRLDEDLTDLTSEVQVIEGRILYLAAKENVSITTDEVKQKIALFIAGSYTEQDAVNDLKEKGLSDEAVQKILPLLARGVEIAKVLNWKEEVWRKEEELEEKITRMSLEELFALNIQELCNKEYPRIELGE